MRILADGRVFERHQEMMDVSSLHGRPAENWRFVDSAGHEHSYGSGFTLPTLKAITYKWYSEDGDEYETVRHYECPLCGERVTPGRIYGERQYAAGIARHYIDGRAVDGETFRAECEKAIRASQDGTKDGTR
jgi:hypothetical protein